MNNNLIIKFFILCFLENYVTRRKAKKLVFINPKLIDWRSFISFYISFKCINFFLQITLLYFRSFLNKTNHLVYSIALAQMETASSCSLVLKTRPQEI